ncbi:MAG: hypothetical protein SGCHY_002106 [Lobulomycetales sp.]
MFSLIAAYGFAKLQGLPIKCLEAVIVAMHLTNNIQELERFVMGFKSQAEGSTYRHIVLVVRHNNSTYGALGLSRRSDLAYKPQTFTSLFDLVEDYKQAYRRNKHELIKVKIGGLISRDMASNILLPFKCCAIDLLKEGQVRSRRAVEAYSRELRRAKREG